MKVQPFDVYRTYLAFKNHFTKDDYDYFKYSGKSRTTVASFNKRRDRYFFERMSRKKDDDEIINYFLANFSSSSDPSKVWIGEIIDSGEENYKDWQKKNQSLSYIFSEEIDSCLNGCTVNELLNADKGSHPKILKDYLRGDMSLETLVILNKILKFQRYFDKKLSDPIWGSVSFKLKKYEPFLNIDVSKYSKILREKIA